MVVKKDMEILVIGVIAGAVVSGVMPLQCIMPKLF
jgi:hypothetical protein